MTEIHKVQILFQRIDMRPTKIVILCPLVSVLVSMKDFSKGGGDIFDWNGIPRQMALIDTGAEGSFFDKNIFDTSALNVAERGNLASIFGSSDVDYFNISLVFSGSNIMVSGLFGSIDLHDRKQPIILGMNILSLLHISIGPGNSGFLSKK